MLDVQIDLANDLFRIKFKQGFELSFEKIRDIVKSTGYEAENARDSDFQSQPVNVRGPTPEFLKPYLEMARKENKFVIAKCSAVWCVSCKKLREEIENDPEIRKLMDERFIMVEIDIEKAKDLKEWFCTNAVPDS